jgi:hypothetical protein
LFEDGRPESKHRRVKIMGAEKEKWSVAKLKISVSKISVAKMRLGKSCKLIDLEL